MSKSLRIAQVAPLWTKVPPDSYGGAELMVHWLTEELVKLGHEVTLYASGDSRTSAKLVSCCERNVISMMADSQAYNYAGYAAANWTECLKGSSSYDLVHCHLGAATIPYSALSRAPVIHTVHEGLDSRDEHWLLRKYPEVTIAAISHSQVATVPDIKTRPVPVIYHGCDTDTYTPGGTPSGYLAFLGRMGPQKNPADAIRTAKELGLPIRLAGTPQSKSEKHYFDEIIKPQIDGANVVYLGSVTQQEKIDLLRQAAAVLFPIQWDEHFGLVMIEAMACGTPVVAIKRGSVPEVIDPGITGYYCDHADELPNLVKQALGLDRHTIRRHAVERFSIPRMVNDYLDLYRKIIAAGKGHGPARKALA
jgi:glycosyltransferase involved in cell wall biosynthesis